MSNVSPGNDYVLDTMALVLRLEKRKMGHKAKTVFENVDSGKTNLFIPGMVFAEFLYLMEKKRIAATLQDLEKYLANHPCCQEYPLDLRVVFSASQILDVPELHDRLIAATSRLLDLPLVTNDPVLQNSTSIKTLWN